MALSLLVGRSRPASSDIQIVNAGPDQFVVTPGRTIVQGSVTANGAVTVNWTQVANPSWPGEVTAVFGTPTALQTTVRFDLPGIYTLRLTAHQAGQADVFDDVWVTVRPRSDFNNDFRADLTWQDQSSGNLGIWYENTIAFLGAVAPVPSNAVPLQWKLAGTGDFDYDGKQDFLWEQYATGVVVVWYMDGSTRKVAPATPYETLATVTDLNWTISGVADFNGDGRDDILWQHADGSLGVWLMNPVGAVPRYTPAALQATPVVSDLDWRVVGVADFNMDGYPDLVWHHQTGGQIVFWYMNGLTFTSAVPAAIAPPDWLPVATTAPWQIVAVGDFGKFTSDDPEGQPDIVFRSASPTTRGLLVWFMSGAHRTSYGWLCGDPGPNPSSPPAPADTWRPSGRQIIPFGTLGAPTFTPVPGTYQSDVVVSMLPGTYGTGSTIRYTRGSTTPSDPDGTSTIFSTGLPIFSNTVFKARADKAGWIGSAVSAPASYTVAVATPTITPGSGPYARGQTIRVETSTPGAVMHYTTDGSAPAEWNPAISQGGTLLLDRAMTLKVGAWRQGFQVSGVASATFTIAGGADRGTALFVVGNLSLSSDDAAVKARLEALGFTVTPILETNAGLAAAVVGKALVVVSVSIGQATTVGAAIRDKAVPIVTWEWNLFPELYLTGTTASDFGSIAEGFLFIPSGAYPLAANRSGDVSVYGSNAGMGWGKPTAGATQVGTIHSAAATNVGLFGYEEGSALFGSGGAAPARRVGIFGAGNNLTLDGLALFDASVNWATAAPKRALFVGTTTADATDTALKARLGAMGFAVISKSQANTSAADAAGKTVIVISGSITSYTLGTTFRDVATPVVNLEYAGWKYMEMTGSQVDADYGLVPGGTSISIVAPLHPLAAGLSGTVVTDSSAAGAPHPQATWGLPAASSLKVATLPGQPAKWSLFAYEKGAPLVNGTAQGRRVGLTPVTTTDGFRLFENSVRWAVAFDSDGDGLSDADEGRLGTNPSLADTNGDGINDGAAIAMGISATNMDMDADGVLNATEILRGTDPFRADTDGDGVSDFWDKFPLDPTRWATGPDVPGYPAITLTEPTNLPPPTSTCSPNPSCQ